MRLGRQQEVADSRLISEVGSIIDATEMGIEFAWVGESPAIDEAASGDQFGDFRGADVDRDAAGPEAIEEFLRHIARQVAAVFMRQAEPRFP